MAEEERKIRKDPAVRVTKLLWDVFGNKEQQNKRKRMARFLDVLKSFGRLK